jgi:hypothetical protein
MLFLLVMDSAPFQSKGVLVNHIHTSERVGVPSFICSSTHIRLVALLQHG